MRETVGIPEMAGTEYLYDFFCMGRGTICYFDRGIFPAGTLDERASLMDGQGGMERTVGYAGIPIPCKCAIVKVTGGKDCSSVVRIGSAWYDMQPDTITFFFLQAVADGGPELPIGRRPARV